MSILISYYSVCVPWTHPGQLYWDPCLSACTCLLALPCLCLVPFCKIFSIVRPVPLDRDVSLFCTFLGQEVGWMTALWFQIHGWFRNLWIIGQPMETVRFATALLPRTLRTLLLHFTHCIFTTTLRTRARAPATPRHAAP